MKNIHAIGIDLGNKYSSVGVWKNNHIEIIPNDFDKRKTLSYVSFTNSELLVGDKAFHKAKSNIKNTVFDIKRLIGRDYNDPNLQSDMKYWPFNIVDKNNKPYIQIQYNNEEKILSPEEITSMIITKLKEMAENYLNQTITDAVITVPAYFNDSQRRATINAGKIAGLNVLKTINEPTAAAITYNYNNKSKGDENILIIDFGEGTYDVSIIHINDSNITIKATAGDTHLGGEDFNNRLVDYFIKEINEKYKIDISSNPKSLYRLRKSCEQVKCDLSSFKEASIEIDYLHDKIDCFSSKITRNSFEELCSDLFKKIIKLIKCVLKDSKLNKKDIHEIVLVGGSTRIPKFQNIISSYFDGKKINKTINVDEAVTYGAVIQASILSKEISNQIKFPIISDVITHSLSIGFNNNEIIDDFIIKRNSKISYKNNYTIHCNKNLNLIKIYEGESNNVINNCLLTTTDPKQIMSKLRYNLYKIVPFVPSILKKINIYFNIDVNGIFHIITTTPELYETSIENMMKNVIEYKKNNEKESQRRASMDNLEKYAYNLSSFIKNERSELNDINYLINDINGIIEWIKFHQNASKEEYDEKLLYLKVIYKSINSN